MIKWYKEKFKGWILTPFMVLSCLCGLYLINDNIRDPFWVYMFGFISCWLILIEHNWLMEGDEEPKEPKELEDKDYE